MSTTIPLEIRDGQPVIPEGWRMVERGERIPKDARFAGLLSGEWIESLMCGEINGKQDKLDRITRQPKEGA